MRRKPGIIVPCIDQPNDLSGQGSQLSGDLKMNQSNKRRVFLKKFFWCGIAAVFVILSAEGTRRLFFCPKLRFPACVMLTDFQSPDDTITGDVTQAFKNVILDQINDDSEIRSMLDDARTIKYSYSAVEVTERQFPEFKSLNRIVDDCTRIMGINRPRVFVEFSRDMNAFSLNPTEPIIILSSELVRYCTEDELRFVIGRECGHIKCNHVQMMTVLFAAKSVLSEGMLTTGLLLPYLNLSTSMNSLRRQTNTTSANQPVWCRWGVNCCPRVRSRRCESNRFADMRKITAITRFWNARINGTDTVLSEI